jgi:hypothetical protein
VQLNTPNKAVIAYLDGRRLKGYVSNLCATHDHFRLFPAENSLHEAGADVELKAIKAIFFVKDFEGNRKHKDAYDAKAKGHGRKIEVTFGDGEKIAGTTEWYHAKNPGFFLFPSDPESNNIRVFIVNSNVQQVNYSETPMVSLLGHGA